MSIHHTSLRPGEFDPLLFHEHFGQQSPGFLESLNARPKTGRYSIVALRSTESFCLGPETGLIHRKNGRRTLLEGDPFSRLSSHLEQHREKTGCPSPFPGGFFGFFSYDLAGWIEELPRRKDCLRDLDVPVLWLDWVDRTAVFDHLSGELHLCSLESAEDLEALALEIRPLLGRRDTALPAPRLSRELVPSVSREGFMTMVRRAQQYIACGDIYQANISCRFQGRWEGTSADLYRRLRHLNPSPFACLLRFAGGELISSSPERLVSLRRGVAETRPIAGTRRRGQNPEEDEALQRELIAHPKERAEHVMLLDLERNDLGRVCEAGSVRVDELMVLEHYAHVTHIVSNVRGRLKAGLGPFDLLRATFPGGTITGAPKKRCMEIIEELEPVGRGSYTGSAGYIGVTGETDLNILIRGFQNLGGNLSYQAGAGIVADSVPEKEWAECLSKGRALRRALEEEL